MDQELVGLVFNTIGVSDGISNGTTGMRYSLVSREVIADSIETIVGAHFYDGLIAVVGCDKNMPGALMAMGRLNRPSLMVYGGSIAGGHWKGRELNIISAFEALGEKVAGKISDEDYKGVIENACPGAGACGGMYTANTMASAIEAMGMSLPYSASNPAISKDKADECRKAAATMRMLLEKDLKPPRHHDIQSIRECNYCCDGTWRIYECSVAFDCNGESSWPQPDAGRFPENKRQDSIAW